MIANENRRLLAIWALLVGVTLVSWALGANNGHAPFVRHEIVTWGVLAFAAIKVRLILRGFMEASHAPGWLKRLTDAWLVLAFGALLLVYTMKWGMTI